MSGFIGEINHWRMEWNSTSAFLRKVIVMLTFLPTPHSPAIFSLPPFYIAIIASHKMADTPPSALKLRPLPEKYILSDADTNRIRHV